jgi:hypothetical protein
MFILDQARARLWITLLSTRRRSRRPAGKLGSRIENLAALGVPVQRCEANTDQAYVQRVRPETGGQSQPRWSGVLSSPCPIASVDGKMLS